jgi:pimeloyl-ACP methyl ester carboxylesterase
LNIRSVSRKELIVQTNQGHPHQSDSNRRAEAGQKASHFARRAILTIFVVLGALTLSATSAKASEGSETPASSGDNSRATLPSESLVLTLDNQSQIYAELLRGTPGKGVFVLLNDLLTEIRSTDTLATALSKEGYTVLRYAYTGQAENLRLLKKGEEPKAFEKGLSLGDLASELDGVLRKAGLNENEKITLVGTSFGSSVAAQFAAQYPDRIQNLVFLAPLVVPLDFYDPQGRIPRLWLTGLRFWENAPCAVYGIFNPYLCSATDYWYDSFFKALHQEQASSLVKGAPAGVDEAVYKKGVFHLLRAARNFDLRLAVRGLGNVHMIVASGEAADLAHAQETAWRWVDEKEKRSLLVEKGAKHELQIESPLATAKWLDGIAQGKEELQKGQRFEASADSKP